MFVARLTSIQVSDLVPFAQLICPSVGHPSYAENDGSTRQHQMSVRGKFLGINRDDCVALAQEFDIRERDAHEDDSRRWRDGDNGYVLKVSTVSGGG